MWSGQKVVELDIRIDEYGSVPPDFSFPEFLPDHFSQSIVNNGIIWISHAKVLEIIRNFDEKEQTSFVSDLYNKYIVISGIQRKEREEEEREEEEEGDVVTSQEFANYVRENPFFDSSATYLDCTVVAVANFFKLAR